MRTVEEFWYWINHIPGVGRRTVIRLLQCFGTPQSVYEASGQALAACLTKEQIAEVEHSRLQMHSQIVCQRLQQLKQQKIAFLWPGHPDYPARLEQLYDAPQALYVRGRLPDARRRMLAIVGARAADAYGREMARRFAHELSLRGVGIVSGLAYGIDGQAHRGALEAGGYTLGILGCGINVCYPPEHAAMYRSVERTGGLLSEYEPGAEPKAWRFPERNRLIAAMSDGILVVQARTRSGSLITVDQGLDLGRDIFALPGRVGDALGEGCNRLIREGARLVTSVEDILEEWGEVSDNSPNFQIHSENALVKIDKMVYSVMRLEPQYIDTVLAQTGLTMQQLLPVLMRLERQGCIRQEPRQYYSVVLSKERQEH